MKRFKIIIILALAFLLSANSPAEPAGFSLETVIKGLEVPWGLEFDPLGDLYFTERPGFVSVYSQGKLTRLATPESFQSLRVEGEAGMMDLALAPDFRESRNLYLCYSYSNQADAPRNKVSRFTVKDDSLLNETSIITEIPGSAGHNGCRMVFGPDGKLYISTGDVFRDTEAQNPQLLNGKILRLNPDGSVPTDNPFNNPVWSYGHRNPQGLVFHPETGYLYSTEHGPATDDELNQIRRGQNYGWPIVMGTAEHEGMTPALQSYSPTDSLALAGMDVYLGSRFPWQGDILFVTLKTGRLYRVQLTDDGLFARDEILLDRNINSNLGRLRDVAVSPDGYVYLATSNRNDRNPNSHPDDDRIVVLRPR